MTQIYANNFTTLVLGRRGENLARKVVFDIRDLESLYGTGDVEVIYQRPGDAQPYPLAVQRDGTLVTWDVTATDTEMSDGSGKCELRYYVGETIVKSKTWQTWVDPAMDTPSETAPPEPEQGWVDQIISVGAAAQASADAAKADADRAAALAAEVAAKAAQTAQNASDAAKAMDAAQTAQRLAEEAQGAAETARKAASAAQAAAETAATDAAGAKQDAETALEFAQDSATAAAKALADIRALYQDMQTWAQGVIQDVDDAGSVAVRSVQTAGDAQVQRVTAEGTTQTANAKAQADAAAQSASGAAQSAQEAAESAAVYDDVVADVNQLKQDLSDLSPSGAAVGQLFRVAAISEDGKYTMEPVDMLDVRVDGKSIVKDGVANIPIASAAAGGVVKVQNVNTVNGGIYISSEGFLSAYNAVKKDIDGRVSQNSISPTNLDYALKAAMCDGKGAEWTAEEQAAARERIGEFTDSPLTIVADATLDEDVSVFKAQLAKSCRFVTCTFIIPPEIGGQNRNIYFAANIDKVNITNMFTRSAPISTSSTNYAFYMASALIVGGKILSFGCISSAGLSIDDHQTRALNNPPRGFCALDAQNFETITVYTYGKAFPAGSQLIVSGC